MELSYKRKQSLLIAFIFTMPSIRVSTITKDILSNLDENINPCENFYKFVCGGFIKKRTIPADKSEVNTFSDIRDELSEQIKELLERPIDDSEPSFIKIIKKTYKSCVNIDQREKYNSEPLKKVLKYLGGWPIVEGKNWKGSDFDWLETIIKIRKIGFSHNTLVGIDVQPDLKNNTIHRIEIDQPTFGMPEKKYLVKGLSDKATKAYFNLWVKAANKLGANKKNSKEELLNAFNFERTLAKLSLPAEGSRNISESYNIFTISKLQELAPKVDWLKLLNGILKNYVSHSEKVRVIAPDFLKKFSKIISNTDKRIIANYMLGRLVLPSTLLLSREWKDMTQVYINKLKGTTKRKNGTKLCLEEITSDLNIAVSSYYVKNYFHKESKDKVLNIVKYIRKEFNNTLNDVNWMDNKTKAEALAKANATTPFIGYPDELLNDSLVSDYYNNLKIPSCNYFNNWRKIKKFNTDNTFSKLRKPSFRLDWRDHANAVAVNAFQDDLDNTIEIPAGILQKSIFNKDKPNYMNFGAIGFIIGHELTHGFDDSGRHFDKEGMERNWWNEETSQHFSERVQCIINQYNNYTVENGMQINGLDTKEENIADNGGIKEAYRAYQSWVKDNGPEPKLPELKYTPNQLFWISAANAWCSKKTMQRLKLSILTGTHASEEYRIIGSFSNLLAFAKDFECPLGSTMNPVHKCHVW